MTHWGRYWKRIGHTPKNLCDWYTCIDSFQLFKNKNFIGLTVSNDRFKAEIAYETNHLRVTIDDIKYYIPVEKQPCNFGGHRYFFRCPGKTCNRRMRKLYCCRGIFLCRKCLNLGYYSQRVVPSHRFSLMQKKLEDKLKDAGGNLWQKPKWMHNKTFKIINARHSDYEWKSQLAMEDEFFKYYVLYP